jgi:site-specific recombinase XerD
MKTTTSRTRKQAETKSQDWPREVQPGRAIVRVYRRKTPEFKRLDGTTGGGNFTYMVANYADGEARRFDSHKNEQDALDAADQLARRLDKRDYVAASMSREQALDYANADEVLKPFGISVSAAANVVAECLKIVGDLSNMHAAAKSYAARNKTVIKKSVAEVITDFLLVKKARTKKGHGASERYMADLDGRLSRFSEDCKKDCANVTTADVQDWLDGLKVDKKSISPQSYRNFRAVLHSLFAFAAKRNYCANNPVSATEKIDRGEKDIEVFTPVEIERLLESARVNHPDYLPCLAIGAFAGLRSAEIERLDWADVDLVKKQIVLARTKTKTASRRVVPILDNLLAWLQPYASRTGLVWTQGPECFYKRQQSIAAATEVKADESKGIKAQKPVPWKANALRHSYASYRYAQTGDAGKVAGEMGNSAAVIFGHYRELVKDTKQAERWFAVKPESPANVLPMLSAAQP